MLYLINNMQYAGAAGLIGEGPLFNISFLLYLNQPH